MLEIKKKSQERIQVVFVGDTSFGENYQIQREKNSYGNILRDKGYDFPLAKMHPILDEADLVIANLETPLTDLKESPFVGKKAFIHWSDIHLAPHHLLRHNIKVVGLANNHLFDYGRQGFEQTLSVLDHAGITYFGGGRSRSKACAPLIIESSIGDRLWRMAVISAYSYRKDSDRLYKCYAGKDDGGICALNQNILSTITELKHTDPSLFVIVFPHWGPNYQWKTARQANMADALVGAGADLIIGHGSHMLQEIEHHNGKWVIFSLGNFMFNSTGRYAKKRAPPYSLVSKLMINWLEGGLQLELCLFPIVTDNLRTGFQPRFVTGTEFSEVLELLSKKGCHFFEEHPNVINWDEGQDRYYFRLDIGWHAVPPLNVLQESEKDRSA